MSLPSWCIRTPTTDAVRPSLQHLGRQLDGPGSGARRKSAATTSGSGAHTGGLGVDTGQRRPGDQRKQQAAVRLRPDRPPLAQLHTEPAVPERLDSTAARNGGAHRRALDSA